MIVSQREAGSRVDHLLAMLLPGMGLRGRRRFCQSGRVLLDGRPALAADKAKAGQVLSLVHDSSQTDSCQTDSPDSLQSNSLQLGKNLPKESLYAAMIDQVSLVKQESGIAAVFKPVGLHTLALAGGNNLSLETILKNPAFWTKSQESMSQLSSNPLPQSISQSVSHVSSNALPRSENGTEISEKYPLFLNRLDVATSGLVLLALNPFGEALWRKAEAQGQIDKDYLALVTGNVPEYIKIRAALDTSHRQISKILAKKADPLRHTEVWNLGRFQDLAASLFAFDQKSIPNTIQSLVEKISLTLVRCRIHKGARHQIRAHLASIGCPLWGDSRYKDGLFSLGEERFFLHHGACQLPGFTASCPAPWEFLLPDFLREKLQKFLATEQY